MRVVPGGRNGTQRPRSISPFVSHRERLAAADVLAALGASRWDLIRHSLSESLVLAVSGAVLGLGVAYASVRLLLLFEVQVQAVIKNWWTFGVHCGERPMHVKQSQRRTRPAGDA